MKLTNISLAILVALGLAACGGSDDNNDQTTDPKETTPIKKEEGPKETPTTTTPPKSGLIPERAAPDMTVPADIENIVATRKTIYIDRTFTDKALGYNDGTGFDYVEDQGTNPANIRTTSTYNFKAKKDVVRDGLLGGLYTEESLGAIHVGVDPTLGTNNAFVKTPKGYVRVAAKVKPIPTTADDNPSTSAKYTPEEIEKIKEDKDFGYRPTTKFYAFKEVGADGKIGDDKWGDEEYDQSEVVFIANAKTDTGTPIGLLPETNKKSPLVLGKEKVSLDDLTPKEQYQYDPAKNEVSLTKVNVFGETYDIGVNGQNIDFGKLPRKAEIQTQEVTGTYQVRNGKGTGIGNDDFTMNKSVKLGNIKAYNLPYAVAFVTTNLDKDNPEDKNLFGIGAFQVAGFKTIALPKQGRALYSGKSFGPTTEGDIELIADFFDDRAGVSGSILNRKDKDGNILANLTLDEVSLTTPENHSTGGIGEVKGDPSYAKVWAVNFYGQEAEEAAGVIGEKVVYKTVGGKQVPDGIDEVKEVFNSQRGKLTNLSNTSDVK